MDRSTLTLLIWVAELLVAAWAQSFFLARLRKHHPVTWNRIFAGREPPALSSEDNTDPSLFLFLIQRQYRSIPDTRLTLLGDATNATWLVVMLTMLFWTLIAGPTNGPPII